MRIMRIGVFFNLNSRKVKLGFFSVERIERIFSREISKHEWEIFPTDDLKEFEKTIKEKVDVQDVAVIVGGDGTLKHFIDIVVREGASFPYIIPVKGGSMNVVHKNIFPRQRPGVIEKKIAQFLNSFNRREDIPLNFVREVRTMVIREGDFEHFGFMVGAGSIWKAMKLYYEMGTGPDKAMELIGKVISGFILGKKFAKDIVKPVECDLKIDGWRYPYSTALGIVASVFRKMVLFTRPFVAEKTKEGFYFLVISESPWTAIRYFHSIALGRKVLKKSYNGIAEKVELIFEGGYTVDGEIYDRNRAHLEIGLGVKVPFLVPMI